MLEELPKRPAQILQCIPQVKAKYISPSVGSQSMLGTVTCMCYLPYRTVGPFMWGVRSYSFYIPRAPCKV